MKKYYMTLLLLISLLSSLTAFTIFLNLDYFTIGFMADAEDLPIKGMQIWGMHKLLAVLIIATLIIGLMLFGWQKMLNKTTSNSSFAMLISIIFLLAIVFFPSPFDFQVRHYNGPANVSYVVLSGDSGDFIDGNEHIFMGKKVKNNTEQIYKKMPNGENDYAVATKLFDCVQEKAFWFGHISVVQSFLPILDKQNGDTLIKKLCKPTNAVIH